MSPLVTSPNRGYADYQRLFNADSGILYTDTQNNQPATSLSPIVDVSRYDYLGLNMGNTVGSLQVQVEWWLDAAATIFVGERIFMTDNHITNGVRAKIANLGPFVQIQVGPLAGLATWFTHVYGTNRVAQVEFTPQVPLVVDQQNVAFPVGTTLFYPSDYFAGPVRVWFQSSVAVNTMALQFLNAANTWEVIDQLQNIAALANTDWNIVTPPGAWRLSSINAGAASNIFVTATPSLTGAT